MPIEFEGEQYLNAAEAARHLGVSRKTFYDSVLTKLQQYHLGVLKRPYYKQSDLDALKKARPIKSELE